MFLNNKPIGPLILEESQTYILTRVNLLYPLCYEIPCTSSIAMERRSERLLMWRLPICLTWSPFRQLYYSMALRYAVFRRADLIGTLCRVYKDFRKFSPNFWNTLFLPLISFRGAFLHNFLRILHRFCADSTHILCMTHCGLTKCTCGFF